MVLGYYSPARDGWRLLMRRRFVSFLWTAALVWPTAAHAAETFDALEKSSVPAANLKRILLPFIATCDREKDHFRRLFCSALNERLKAQHQSKVYRSTFEPSEAGPLVVRYKAKPKPSLELDVMGCLTCKEPMLERAGGDVSKGRFFVFNMPKDIKIRRGKLLYDLGDIGVERYTLDLPQGMTEKRFNEEIRPFLRLDLVYRPVAGVTMVGGKYKYGVLQFELLGHRAYDRCAAKVYGVAPKMAGKLLSDKTDMTCPQNQTKKVVARPNLPVGLPKVAVRTLLQQVAGDLHTCYEEFGILGETPADIVISPRGKVKLAKVTGKLGGTPTAECVERLIKETEFPRFAGEDARVQWPFVIRN
jgi:hypothetical protein